MSTRNTLICHLYWPLIFGSLVIGVLVLLSGNASAQSNVMDSDASVTSAFTRGFQVNASDAAGLELEAHIAIWAREVMDLPAQGESHNYFEVPLVRPMLQARAFDGLLRLMVQPELAGPSPQLLDLEIDLNVLPELRFKVGQFRTPHSRAFLNPVVRLSMLDFGLVSDAFRAGRDTGLMVLGDVGNAFEYNVGVFNGTGTDVRPDEIVLPMVMGRVVVSPYGYVPYDQAPSLASETASGLALGLSGFVRERRVVAGPEPATTLRTASVGAELSLVQGPLAFFSEVYLREERSDAAVSVSDAGAFTQAGVFVVPEILELIARTGWIEPDMGSYEGHVRSYEGAVKGYFHNSGITYGHHLSLVLRYSLFDTPLPYRDLPVGVTHRVMTQLQVWI